MTSRLTSCSAILLVFVAETGFFSNIGHSIFLEVGSMSAQVSAKKRMKYDPNNLTRAMAAVREGMSKKLASKTFGIPRTTLLDKLAGRVPVKATIGRKPILNANEETTLVRYATLMADIGYPLTKAEFLKEVKYVLDIDQRKTPFKHNLPGHKWFVNFQARNPGIGMRKPMSLGHERAKVTIDKVENWYTGLEAFLSKEVDGYQDMLRNPRRLFNGDESGFPLTMKPDRVIASKGSKNVYQIVSNNKTQITVMAACNAVGEFVKPMILFPGERLRDVGMAGFPEARYSVTKNGWMDSDTFVAYLEHLVDFAKEQGIEFPILFFVDGHSTHITLAAAEFCHTNGVVLYCLVPNATHIMQPLDIGIFSPMKRSWQKTVKQWQIEHFGEMITKKDFPGIFKKTWDECALFENAAHGFRKAGLFPLTINGIDKTKLNPSLAAAKCSKNEDSQLESENAEDQAETHSNEQDSQSSEVEDQTDTMHQIISIDGSGPKSDTIAENTKPQVVIETSETSQNKQDVSKAFLQLRVPTPKEKRTVKRVSDTLPKAISGSKALEMLRQREDKKRSKEAAKLKRKEERLLKKQLKEAELEKKRIQREEKQAIKASKAKNAKRKRINKPKRKHESSDSECDTSALIDDADSDDYEEDFEMCPSCNKGDQHPSMWKKCDECSTRWHFMCANRPDIGLLEEDERKKIEFTCPLCI